MNNLDLGLEVQRSLNSLKDDLLETILQIHTYPELDQIKYTVEYLDKLKVEYQNVYDNLSARKKCRIA